MTVPNNINDLCRDRGKSNPDYVFEDKKSGTLVCINLDQEDYWEIAQPSIFQSALNFFRKLFPY